MAEDILYRVEVRVAGWNIPWPANVAQSSGRFNVTQFRLIYWNHRFIIH